MRGRGDGLFRLPLLYRFGNHPIHAPEDHLAHRAALSGGGQFQFTVKVVRDIKREAHCNLNLAHPHKCARKKARDYHRYPQVSRMTGLHGAELAGTMLELPREKTACSVARCASHDSYIAESAITSIT
jgi:hypothetical protein